MTEKRAETATPHLREAPERSAKFGISDTVVPPQLRPLQPGAPHTVASARIRRITWSCPRSRSGATQTASSPARALGPPLLPGRTPPRRRPPPSAPPALSPACRLLGRTGTRCASPPAARSPHPGEASRGRAARSERRSQATAHTRGHVGERTIPSSSSLILTASDSSSTRM
jgi:hypothetical protein